MATLRPNKTAYVPCDEALTGMTATAATKEHHTTDLALHADFPRRTPRVARRHSRGNASCVDRVLPCNLALIDIFRTRWGAAQTCGWFEGDPARCHAFKWHKARPTTVCCVCGGGAMASV